MTDSTAFDKPPQPGVGPWWCPVCDRATPTTYRCANYDCGADLAGVRLTEVGERD